VEARLYLGPVDTLGASTTPVAILRAPYVGSGRWIDGLEIGSEVAALHIAPTGEMVIFHAGSLTAVTGGGNVAIEGDHVVWDSLDSFHLRHWTPEVGFGELYFTEPDTNYLGLPFVDQGTLVWISIPPTGPLVTTVWTSPFGRTPADVVARQVTPDAGDPLHALYGDGIFIARRGAGPDFSAQLTDIADGRIRILGIPEGALGCSELLYVSSTELALKCWTATTPVVVSALYRIDPRTLPYVS
jgi:hypothetical protein